MGDRITRILTIYTELLQGNIVNKRDMSIKFGVHERTIQRDIQEIRAYMANDLRAIIYDDVIGGYRLNAE